MWVNINRKDRLVKALTPPEIAKRIRRKFVYIPRCFLNISISIDHSNLFLFSIPLALYATISAMEAKKYIPTINLKKTK
jgi:hypothetical protein